MKLKLNLLLISLLTISSCNSNLSEKPDKPNFIIQAKKWDTKKIKSMLDKIYRLEIVFKTNSLINKKILMKKLLVDMCNVANA